MPHTVAIRGDLAKHLLSNPNPALRRRLAVLRLHPFPPGSRSLGADPGWMALAHRYPRVEALVYGTDEDALVYTLDRENSRIVVLLAIVRGRIVP